jgi:hypothetical protein
MQAVNTTPGYQKEKEKQVWKRSIPLPHISSSLKTFVLFAFPTTMTMPSSTKPDRAPLPSKVKIAVIGLGKPPLLPHYHSFS